MEKVEYTTFSPLGRIGQLTVRNPARMDTRDKLAIYAKAGRLSLNSTTALAQLESENK